MPIFFSYGLEGSCLAQYGYFFSYYVWRARVPEPFGYTPQPQDIDAFSAGQRTGRLGDVARANTWGFSTTSHPKTLSMSRYVLILGTSMMCPYPILLDGCIHYPKSLTRSVGFTSMLLRRDSLKHCVSFSFGMRGFICLLLAALLWHRMFLMRKGGCLEPALILGGVEHRHSNLIVFLSFGGVRSMPEDSGHGSYQKRFSPWELWHIRSRSETGQGAHIPSHAHAFFHVCKKNIDT